MRPGPAASGRQGLQRRPFGTAPGDEQVGAGDPGDGGDRRVDLLLAGQRAEVGEDRRVGRQAEAARGRRPIGGVGDRAAGRGHAVGDDPDPVGRDAVPARSRRRRRRATEHGDERGPGRSSSARAPAAQPWPTRPRGRRCCGRRTARPPGQGRAPQAGSVREPWATTAAAPAVRSRSARRVRDAQRRRSEDGDRQGVAPPAVNATTSEAMPRRDNSTERSTANISAPRRCDEVTTWTTRVRRRSPRHPPRRPPALSGTFTSASTCTSAGPPGRRTCHRGTATP